MFRYGRYTLLLGVVLLTVAVSFSPAPSEHHIRLLPVYAMLGTFLTFCWPWVERSFWSLRSGRGGFMPLTDSISLQDMESGRGPSDNGMAWFVDPLSDHSPFYTGSPRSELQTPFQDMDGLQTPGGVAPQTRGHRTPDLSAFQVISNSVAQAASQQEVPFELRHINGPSSIQFPGRFTRSESSISLESRAVVPSEISSIVLPYFRQDLTDTRSRRQTQRQIGIANLGQPDPDRTLAQTASFSNDTVAATGEASVS